MGVCALKICRAYNSVKCRESFDMPSCVRSECSFMSLQNIVAYQQAHYLIAGNVHTHTSINIIFSLNMSVLLVFVFLFISHLFA